MIIKIYLVLIYILLNFVSGIVLCIYYLGIEKKISNAKEFLLILFFPVYGLGSWKFNRLRKEENDTSYPQRYYVLKYLFRLHLVFYVVLLGSSSYFFIEAMAIFAGTDKSIDNSSFGTEALYYFGNALLSFTQYVIIAAFLTIQFLIAGILIIIPYIMLKKYKPAEVNSFQE